ncbi:MAG: hypothetical protein AB2448_11230 [Moorella sp. (in: firmicutes)]
MNRREFFRHGLSDCLKSFWQNLQQQDTGDMSLSSESYFSSFLSCYPLLSEAPYDALVAAAQKMGINVEHKSKLELAREIFGRRPQNNNETS